MNVVLGWLQYSRKQRRQRRPAPSAGIRWRCRQPLFEQLEERRLLTTNFASIADTLDGQLVSMESAVTSAFNNYTSGPHSTLPFLGDSLGNALEITDYFRQQLHDALHDLGSLESFSNSVIQNALWQVPLVADRNGNGLDPGDVLVTRPGNLGADGFAVQMRLQKGQTPVTTPVNFETGLPGLPVSITANGAIEVIAGFAYELAFTYNSNNQQVALDSTKTLDGLSAPNGNFPMVDPLNPLAVFVSAGLSNNFSATANIGFVRGTATPIPGATNALHVTALLNNLTGTPTIKIDGGADANLRLEGSFAGSSEDAADFPGIDADFHLHWSLNSNNPAAAPPQVSFDQVHLDLGRFVSDVVGPIFELIQDTTAPLNPIREILATPLPGITDLARAVGIADSVTLLDIGGVIAPYTGFGPLYDLIHKAILVNEQIDDLEIGETVRMPLGGFNLNSFDLRGTAPAGDISDLDLENLTEFTLNPGSIQGLGQTFNEIVDSLGLGEDETAFLHSLTEGFNNGFEIQFPILDRPQDTVFDLLLGRDSDLFTLTAEAHVNAAGNLVPSVSTFGLGVQFGGAVEIDTKFRFAYDTYGLRLLLNNILEGNSSDILSDILDGFYIASDSFFEIGGRIHAGVGASAGIFSAVVGGFVSTDDDGEDPVRIDIDDPNGDGKLRFAEFGDSPFDMSGRLSAALGIEVRIGVEVLGTFIGLSKRFDIAETVLVDFNDPDPGNPTIPPNPTLASSPDESGRIDLYIGQLAHLRQGEGVNQENGNEKLIIRNVETTPQGETIEIALRHEFLGLEYYIKQEIAGVRSITGVGDIGDLEIDVLPGVNVDVHFQGGQGKAELRYNGTGSAQLVAAQDDSYLLGGAGVSTLVGGPGDDTLVLGSNSNFGGGGAGNNTIIITAPPLAAGAVAGGTDPLATNTAVVMAGVDLAAMTAVPSTPNFFDLTFQKVGDPAVSPSITLSNFTKFLVNAQDRMLNVTVGDLSPAGVTQTFLHMNTTGDGGRNIVLGTKSDGAVSDIRLEPFTHVYVDPWNPLAMIQSSELQLINQTTGMTTYLLGVKPGDLTTVQHHGGSVAIGPLTKDAGTFKFDFSARAAGAPEIVTMTTPAATMGNAISTSRNEAGQFVVEALSFPTLIFHSVAANDSITIDVSAPGSPAGINVIDLEASAMRGALTVNALGGASVKNSVTLSSISSEATVTMHGGSTTTDLLFGTGQLAAIAGNATATNVKLTVDNSAAPVGSILTLTASTFGNWIIPGVGSGPRLEFSGLRGLLEVFAGAGDRLQLDVTPTGITGLTVHNDTATLDRVFTANWTVPIIMLGNLAFYAGQRIGTDGTVERVKRLANVAVPVTLQFQGGAATSEVVLDGDLDPPGAQYTIDGTGNLHVVNNTVGLGVTINGYRDQDRVYIHMAGANVAADLRKTGPGSIYFDGKARLEGIHPTDPNQISAALRAGNISLDPLDTYDSVMHSFNTVYVLGSLQQDILSLNQPTTFKVAPSAVGSNQTSWGVYVPGVGNTSANVSNPPPEHYAVLALSFVPTSGRGEPAILTSNFPGQAFVDSYITDLSVVVPAAPNFEGHATVRVFPSNPTPVPTNNVVNLDGSQLRGALQYQALEPDYTLAESLVAGLNQFGGVAKTSLAQTTVNLSKVHRESNVTIAGIDPISDLHVSNLNRSSTVADITQFGGLAAYIGGGLIKNIEGNVTLNKTWLKEVDDRNGALPGILKLTATTLSGWATASGMTQPTLTFGTLLGDLLLTGSSVDQFNVESTPVHAPHTTIRNLSTSGLAPGVYVMGKTVMPLTVEGNFTLTVGRRLNSDGTITAAGLVDNVFNRNTKFQVPGGVIRSSYIFENFELWNYFTRQVAPPLTYNTGGYINPAAISTPLPVFFNYTGPGQTSLVFDSSQQVITLGGSSFDTTIAGISSNTYYPGKNDLRYRAAGDVIFGSNIEAFFYGPVENGGTANRPGPRVVINNLLNAPIHYIANPASAGGMEQVLIGAAEGPVLVEGNGRGTRVELNPLFSMPITVTGSSLLAGFAGGNVGGYSLMDTIHSEVTVTNAALRVIADIPLPAGYTPAATHPSVTLNGDQLLGIAGGAVRLSNLTDSVLLSGNIVSGSLDIDAVRMPGLSIQLPAHLSVSTDVADTPAGATTYISTLLSSSDAATTAGPITVRGTTGPLALGELFGGGASVRFTWPLVAGQPIGSLTWADGLSVPQVTIGHAGSLDDIHGSILLSGDSHANSPIATIIDGSGDASRANVSFGRWASSQSPEAMFVVANTGMLNNYYVQDLAQAPIYFGTFFSRPRPVNVYGSGGSTYNINGGVTPATVPPTMKLYTGTDGTVVNNTGYAGPMSIIGATNVQLILGTSAAISGYTGLPQVLVEQDPAHPQPIQLRLDRRTQSPFTPGGTLTLSEADNGRMSLVHANTWQVLYPGDSTHFTINSGPIVVNDTGAGGTVISSAGAQVDVVGTTGPLRIDPSGVSGSNTVRLAPAGNMQAILGDLEIRSNASPLGFTTLTLNNSADAIHRNVHLATDADGSTRITGLAPNVIKLVGERFGPTLTGGTGGSTFYVESRIFPLTSTQFTITGGSVGDILVGPNLANTWTLDAANSVRLGANVRANNLRNLRGGNDNDLFRSTNSSGTLAGNLDGGGGFNTLEYIPIPSPFVTDLGGGHAPRITGTVNNIQAVIPEQLNFTAPSPRSDLDGDVINLQLTATSTVGGTLTFGASGLPAGLSINPSTGMISGTIAADAHLASPYLATVTVTNGSNSRLRTIQWGVADVFLPGDSNNDGAVDAADYIILRKNGASQAEYGVWRSNFGNSRVLGGGASLPTSDSQHSPMGAAAPTGGSVAEPPSVNGIELRSAEHATPLSTETTSPEAEAIVFFQRSTGFTGLDTLPSLEPVSRSHKRSPAFCLTEFAGNDLLLLAADRAGNQSRENIDADLYCDSDHADEAHWKESEYPINGSVTARRADLNARPMVSRIACRTL